MGATRNAGAQARTEFWSKEQIQAVADLFGQDSEEYRAAVRQDVELARLIYGHIRDKWTTEEIIGKLVAPGDTTRTQVSSKKATAFLQLLGNMDRYRALHRFLGESPEYRKFYNLDCDYDR